MSSGSSGSQLRGPIPPRHKELLNKEFGEGKWQTDKPLEGYSGASVYLVIYQSAPIIVKVAHTDAIQREYDNYHAHAATKISNIVPHSIAHPTFSQDGQEALIRYSHAGDYGTISQSQTLYKYLTDAKSSSFYEYVIRRNVEHKRIKFFSSILSNMFRKEGRSWWGNAKLNLVKARSHYERFLPVNLQITPFTAPPSDAHTLRATEIEHNSIANLKLHQALCLEGFKIEKSEEKGITLTAQPPHETPIRLRVLGKQGTPGEVQAPIYGYIEQTRETFLYQKAKEVIRSIDLDTKSFTLEGQSYPNPIFYLDELLDKPYYTNESIIHGDLNLRNILVENTRQANNQLKRYWLIDFASTGEGPVLLDLQWLETQVINWLVVPALANTAKGPKVLATLLECLHRGKELPLSLRRPLRLPFSLLKEIRNLASDYLYEKSENPERWQEYYRGLTIMLIGTLKHEMLRQGIHPDINKYALISAATTVQWTGVNLPTPARSPYQWLGYGLGVFLVVAISLGLYKVGPGNKGSTSMPTQKPLPPTTPTPLSTVSSVTVKSCDPKSSPLKIGIAINKSGRYSVFGHDQIIGYQIAEKYFNEQGGINGRCIQVLDDYDLKSATAHEDQVMLTNALTELVKANVIGIIAPGLSQQALLISDTLQSIRTPVLGASVTRPGLICKNEFFSRVSATGKWYIEQALYKAFDKVAASGINKAKIAIAYANDDAFTLAEAGIFTNTVQHDKKTFELLGKGYAYETGSNKLVELAQQIIGRAPDIVIISGLTIDGGSLIKALREAGFKGPIVGGNGLNTPYLFNECENCENLFIAQAYSYMEDRLPIQKAFVDTYKNYPKGFTESFDVQTKPQNDPNPGQFAAQMFTAVQVLVEALRDVNQETAIQDNDLLQAERLATLRKKLNDKLLSRNKSIPFETPLGLIWLNREGEVMQSKFYVAESEVSASQGYHFKILDTPWKIDPENQPEECK